MEICGVVCEWNPFHNGHAYLLKEAKKQGKADGIVAIMSGNYVQRGEPAVASKWERAYAGLRNGSDLVVELPFWYSAQSANEFASGAVKALIDMGCTQLAFGVEEKNFKQVEEIADWISEHLEIWEDWQKESSPYNESYATRQNQLIERVQRELGLTPHSLFRQSSNTLLGFLYALENARQGHPLTLLPIERQGQQHRESDLKQSDYISSTSIRNYFEENHHLKGVKSYLDEGLYQSLKDKKEWPSMKKLYPYMRFIILGSSEKEQLSWQGWEKDNIKSFEQVLRQQLDYDSILEELTHRRWSKYRVQRALLMASLQVKREEIYSLQKGLQPLLILGMTKIGRNILKVMKKKTTSRYVWISRMSQKEEEQWPKWIKADLLYHQFLLEEKGDENIGHPPYLI